MVDTSSDEALAKALQQQLDEEDLSPAMLSPLSPTPPPSKPVVKTWSDWWGEASNQAMKLAQDAAEASISAAAVAKHQAAALAAQAEELRKIYDPVISNAMFGGINNSANSRTDRAPTDVSASAQKQGKKDLDLVYITENIIVMAFPSDPRTAKDPSAGNNIHEVAAYLKRHHEGKFMIWNVSEEAYDTSLFASQVLDYKFPGHPAPPLGLLFKICTSMQSWLDADADNVAVVHCLTGRGRSAALTACVLSWLGEFSIPSEALEYVAARKQLPIEQLTIPSQRRYVQYFANTLDGVRPRPEPLLLRRIILNSVPVFGALDGREGCCPYIQLFKGGKLICTVSPPTTLPAAAMSSEKVVGGSSQSRPREKSALQWVSSAEGCVSFHVDCAVQGDILLRCRHAEPSGQRVSMFRAAFHTGYTPNGVLRLSRVQLDGCDEQHFAADFFMDLVFAPIESAVPTSSKAGAAPTVMGSAVVGAGAPKASGIGVTGPPSDSGLVIDAASADRYEAGIHRDVRFWDAIAERKRSASVSRTSRKFDLPSQERFIIADADGSGGATPVRAAASAGSTTAVSNEDLIQQLARAELGDTADEFDEDARAGDDISRLLLRGAGAASASSAAAAELTSELLALEALEKELGLADLSYMKSAASGPGTPATPAAVVGTSPAAGFATATTAATPLSTHTSAEEDFDELEQYLESLSAGKP